MRARLAHVLLAAFAATTSACSSDVTNTTPLTTLDITGVVTSATTGAPIAGAQVELAAIRFMQSGTVTHTTTGANGSYTLRPRVDCASGWYYFDVSAHGYATESTLLSDAPVPCSAQPQTHSFALTPFETSVVGGARD